MSKIENTFSQATPAVDPDAYFARIGYDGPREPTLAVLRAIAQKHLDAIPFENLDVLLGKPISLVPADVDAKLITAGRGGYCYEQNGLLKRVLIALGFQVEALIARMMWMKPADAPSRARSHMVLRVTIDAEPWLVDVGFAGCVLTGPVRFALDGQQATPNGLFRSVRIEEEWRIEADLTGVWTPVYQVSPQPMADVDFEPVNFYSYAHPTSVLTSTLVVGRTTPEPRHVLRDNRLTVRRVDGAVEQRCLSTDELEATLRNVIGLPVETSWRPVLEKVVALGTPT